MCGMFCGNEKGVETPPGVGIGGSKFRKFGVKEDYWKATGSNAESGVAQAVEEVLGLAFSS